jgi:NADPH:quinone reductase-like Zn-dependent oxidoreductase
MPNKMCSFVREDVIGQIQVTIMQRQAYQLKAGSLNNLQLVADELPDPQPNEVAVAVKAIGLNFADIFAIWGLYAATPEGIFTPGLEYAGVIAKVGSGGERLEGRRPGHGRHSFWSLYFSSEY